MAVTFTYPATGIALSQVHDELLAAGLAPERVEHRWEVTVVPPAAPGPDGFPTFPREERTLLVALTFPDGQARGPVDAVVAAHVPRVRYDPATLLARRAPALAANRRAALLVRAAGATTVDEVRDVLVAHLKAEEEAQA